MATTKDINRISNKGINIDKVLCGGGIVWHKPFKWKVYSLKTVNVYKYKIHKEESNNWLDGYVDLYEDITINEYTGEITLKKEVEAPRKTGYFKYSGVIYYGYTDYNPYTYNAYTKATSRYTASKYFYKSYKEKDNYVKEVNSNSLDTYPKNGIQGDYWYEFIR